MLPKNEMPFELRRGRSLFTLPDPIKSAGEAAAPATVSLGGVFCEVVKELTEHRELQPEAARFMSTTTLIEG